MTFSVCVVRGNLIDMRFAIKDSEVSPNFGLVGFDMRLFIKEFKEASLNQRRIPILWKMLVDSLRKIGYFDIYDYNHFQMLVLRFFQRMFIFPNYKTNLVLFYSFVQRLLAKNSWFLIVGEFIQPVVGRPHSMLINCFSDHANHANLPIVNFIDSNSGVVGLTTHVGDGSNFRFVFNLVSLPTTQTCVVGSSNQSEGQFGKSLNSADILKKLFPSYRGDYDSDDSCPLLRRTPTKPRTSSIQDGVSRIGRQNLIVFKLGNMIYVFIQRADGTFDPFNTYFFIMSKMLVDSDEFDQLKKLFTDFYFVYVHHFIEGLLKCGFQSIIDGTATNEEIRAFLLDSDLGQVLQELRKEFGCFQEPDCSMKNVDQLKSIRENRFIMEFKRIFEFILEQLRERHDLEPEIVEILHFLDQLVKFLTVPPASK
jgi:hypothetical protein